MDNSAKDRLDLEIDLLRQIAFLMYQYSRDKMNADKEKAVEIARVWRKYYGKKYSV